jgi:hypothetical protein
MSGPPPKAAGTRARRNKTSTATVLHLVESTESTWELPTRGDLATWEPLAVRFWSDVVAQLLPSGQLVPTDFAELYALTDLIHRRWSEDGGVRYSSEIRLAGQRFGITPLDRRRLQWEVEKVEAAVDARKSRRRPTPVGRAKSDPRSALG